MTNDTTSPSNNTPTFQVPQILRERWRELYAQNVAQLAPTLAHLTLRDVEQSGRAVCVELVKVAGILADEAIRHEMERGISR